MVLFDYWSVIILFFVRKLRTVDVYFYKRCLFSQERVSAVTVDDRERGGKTGEDAPDLRGFHLFGSFNPFPRDKAVVDCSESEQLYFVAFLEVQDYIAVITVQDIQHIPFGERRFLGNLLGGIAGRKRPIIKGRGFEYFFPGLFTRNSVLAN